MLSPQRLQEIQARIKSNFAGQTFDFSQAAPHMIFLSVLHEIASHVELAVSADQVHDTVLTENPALLAMRSFFDYGLTLAPQPAKVVTTFSCLVPISTSQDVEFVPAFRAGTKWTAGSGQVCTALQDFSFAGSNTVTYYAGDTQLSPGAIGVGPSSITVDAGDYQVRYVAVPCAVCDSDDLQVTVDVEDTSRSPVIVKVPGGFSSVFVSDDAGLRYHKVPRWAAAVDPASYVEMYDANTDTLYLVMSNTALCKRPKQGTGLTITYLKTSTLIDDQPTQGDIQLAAAVESDLSVLPAVTRLRAAVANSSLDVVVSVPYSPLRYFEPVDLIDKVTRRGQATAIAGPQAISDLMHFSGNDTAFHVADIDYDANTNTAYVWKRLTQKILAPPTTSDLLALQQSIGNADKIIVNAPRLLPGNVVDVQIYIKKISGSVPNIMAISTQLDTARDRDGTILNLQAIDDPAIIDSSVSIASTTINHQPIISVLSKGVYKFQRGCRYNIATIKVVEV